MRTVKSDEAGMREAAAVLDAGGVVVIPTDTVYGLAARPDRPDAVARLYSIKDRDAKKPIALLVADIADAEKYIGSSQARTASGYWPGALTVVSGDEAVRIPDQEWTRSLLRLSGGALRVTSANMSGERPVTDAGSSLSAAGLGADLAVDGGISPGGAASTVIRIAGDGSIGLIRRGPVKFLTLASGSPRRSRILRELGVDFIVAKSDAPEVCYDSDPERTVRENALAKGASFESPVLSADTVVWFDGRVYGKPRDLEEAAEFLRRLGGKTHYVFTALAFNGDVKVERSAVRFRVLPESAITEYIERVKPLDRAGAYDIDESGDLIVESYEGSYENIMGLPVGPLREWGIVG